MEYHVEHVDIFVTIKFFVFAKSWALKSLNMNKKLFSQLCFSGPGIQEIQEFLNAPYLLLPSSHSRVQVYLLNTSVDGRQAVVIFEGLYQVLG